MNPFTSPTLLPANNFEGVYFTTLWLRDALPESFGQSLALQYYTQMVKYAHHADRFALLQQIRKRLFVRLDQALDLEKYGHPLLKQPVLAQTVADEMSRIQTSEGAILAYTIMPNHLHLLLDLHHAPPEALPLEEPGMLDFKPLRDLSSHLKLVTERSLKKAMRQLGAHIDPEMFQKHHPTGRVKMDGKCWHDRSFDFRVKDAAGYGKIARYMIQNPVKAGLVEDWEIWPFSHHS